MNEEYKKIYSDLKDNFKLTKRFDNSSVHSYLSQYFLNVMGYGNNGTYIHSENECSVIVEDELIIQLYNNYAKEQAINAITYKCEQDAIEWGILIHEDGMFLINSCIEYGNEAYKSDKIVFNIEYSRPADKKYLKYFTYDNLIQRRNTCYFRDLSNINEPYQPLDGKVKINFVGLPSNCINLDVRIGVESPEKILPYMSFEGITNEILPNFYFSAGSFSDKIKIPGVRIQLGPYKFKVRQNIWCPTQQQLEKIIKLKDWFLDCYTLDDGPHREYIKPDKKSVKRIV